MVTPIFAEVKARLVLREAESERMLRRFRALPVDHPERVALLRQLEVAAGVAAELESLLDLEGRDAWRSLRNASAPATC
jgi:hypothetical protein